MWSLLEAGGITWRKWGAGEQALPVTPVRQKIKVATCYIDICGGI